MVGRQCVDDAYVGAGYDARPLAGIGRKYPLIPEQMNLGAWHPRCQSGDEVVPLE
jgi:hypothetical protein